MITILKKILLLPLAWCFLLFSCENNVEEEDVTEIQTPILQENEPTPQPVLSFSQNVKPIIDNNCVVCHGGNRFPDLRSQAIIAQNSGLIKNVVVTRRMPQGGSLSNEQIATIRDWIDGGALDN